MFAATGDGVAGDDKQQVSHRVCVCVHLCIVHMITAVLYMYGCYTYMTRPTDTTAT